MSKSFKQFAQDFKKEIKVEQFRHYIDGSIRQESFTVSLSHIKRNKINEVIPPPLSVSLY